MMGTIRRLIREYQNFLISGMLLFCCAIAILVGIIPGGKKVFELFSARKTLSAEVQQLQKKASVLESLDEETLRTQLLALTGAIPSDKSIQSAFSTVEQLSATSGVVLGGMTVANPGALATESAKKQTAEEKKLGSNILTFSILFEGTPEQVSNFFAQAVRVRRSLRVRFFDVTILAVDHLSVRAAMDAFYAPIPSSLGDILAAVNPLKPEEETIIANVSQYPLYTLGLSEAAPLAVPVVRDPFNF